VSTLNNARIVLVATAVFAALLAAFAGRWSVVAILLVAVAMHGVLWFYLYGNGRHGERPPVNRPPRP
jgi:fatty acid desaturase